MDGETCASCKFFKPFCDGTTQHEVGECRAGPPQIFLIEDEPVSAFPQVDQNEWCGSWKANQ